MKPADVFALPSAGSKRSRKQKERKECTLSDVENGHSSESDDDASVEMETNITGGIASSSIALTGEAQMSHEGDIRVPVVTAEHGVAALSLSVSEPIAPVGINVVPSSIRAEEVATDDSEPVIVPNAQAEAEAAAVPSAPASLKPPINAIANGNWIGYLPRMFWSISRTEEQACALIHVNIYLTTVIGSGYGNKMMNFHNFPRPAGIRNALGHCIKNTKTTASNAIHCT